MQTSAVSRLRSRSSAAAEAPDAVVCWNRSTTGTSAHSTCTAPNASTRLASRARCTWKHAGVLTAHVHRPVVALPSQPHANHPDPAVPEIDQMPSDRGHRRMVVDPHVVHPVDLRLVADHGGQRALQHGREVRVVLGTE